MSPGEDSVGQPRRRGRPKKQKEVLAPVQEKMRHPVLTGNGYRESADLREVQRDIYQRVMELFTTVTDDDAREWQITQAIFEEALLHLDAERRGLAITYAKLMPAREDGVHSLVETTMRGNDPWTFALENHTYLGSTTLAGTSAMLNRLQTWDNFSKSERLQFEIDEFERSACAYPVIRAGQIAGVLIISSTQPRFFIHPIACQAVIMYAQLLSLAFREKEFLPFSRLSLRPMPDLKWQREEISQSYVRRIMACAMQKGIARQEAELLVRRDMEAEFEEIGEVHLQKRLFSEEHVEQK
jgi:hypothetical protein